jgi:hypothetical protein
MPKTKRAIAVPLDQISRSIVIQAANILNSPRAVEMSVYVVRAFGRLRELLTSNKELAAILSAIREQMNPTTPKRRGVGFTAKL